MTTPPLHRCGLVAIVGRPNVGKSTLLNALVGQKISITSRKPQTTRHRITGVRTRGECQFVFVDTPGYQTREVRGRGALNRTLNRTVLASLSDVDVVLFVVEAGRFSLDDALCAGLILRQVAGLCGAGAEWDDQAGAMAALHEAWQDRLPQLLQRSCRGYRHLHGLGFREDLDFCLRPDLFPVVPRYRDGSIRAWAGT